MVIHDCELSLTALFEINKEGIYTAYVEEFPDIVVTGSTFEQTRVKLFNTIRLKQGLLNTQFRLSIKFRYSLGHTTSHPK